jgi:threonine dehydrogenase-like Zn-dependent dehydrogenase
MQFIKASGGIAIVSDLSKMANKLELAKEYGADAVLPNDQCDLVSEVKKMTGGRGADFVFECTGVDACINQAIMMTRFKGTVVELALTNMKGSMLQAYPAVSLNAIRIQGSFGHTIGIWPRVISLMSSGKVKTAELVSHKYNFEECEQAFACNGPDKVKILLHP